MVSFYSHRSLTCIFSLICLAAISSSWAREEIPLDVEGREQLMQKLEELRKGSKSIRVEFQESRKSPLLARPVVSRGTLYFSPPDSFRRETVQPQPSQVISDGKTLWMVYPEFDEVEIYPLQKLPAVGHMLRAISSSLDPAGLSRRFRVNAFSIPDGFLLDLEPRGVMRREISRVRLELDSSLKVRSTWIRTSEGGDIQIDFQNETFHEVPSGFFQFQPPPKMQISRPLG